ncbi:MAG TPA: plasmid pRiA4b ORF-3 family protein [Gammaproteobacteria bacterium]
MKKRSAQVTPLKTANIYQIKVTLKWSNPPIWRRLQLRGDTKLGQLHHILQITMGWWDEHLHAFEANGISYGEPDPDIPSDLRNERNVRLDKIAQEGDVIKYEYDFGDGWMHELKIEEVLDPEPGTHYPRCIAGARACPPEDCGGVPGYERMLAILANPKDEEYQDIREWLGEEFDPEAFDLAAVNEELGA